MVADIDWNALLHKRPEHNLGRLRRPGRTWVVTGMGANAESCEMFSPTGGRGKTMKFFRNPVVSCRYMDLRGASPQMNLVFRRARAVQRMKNAAVVGGPGGRASLYWRGPSRLSGLVGAEPL